MARTPWSPSILRCRPGKRHALVHFLQRAFSPLAPVLGGEGSGVRGRETASCRRNSLPPDSIPLTPALSPRSTGGEGECTVTAAVRRPSAAGEVAPAGRPLPPPIH